LNQPSETLGGKSAAMSNKYKPTQSEINTMLQDLGHILKSDDERDVIQTFLKYGIKEEDPKISELVKNIRPLTSRRP
jgi:hypothetical protein